MRPPPEERKLISRIAANEGYGNTETADELRAELRALKWERHIRALIDAAPPLTEEQRTRLAALLQTEGTNA